MDVTMIQHPVGQGGMFSGQLQAGNTTLRWVYDCGSNQQDRLSEEILSVADRGAIDLMFLSHLDSDHVNGVDRLLAATTVEEVVLPYLNAVDYAVAVIQDIEAGTLSGTFLEFVADPVKWLIGRGIRKVSFVRVGGGDKSLGEMLSDAEQEGPGDRGADGIWYGWSSAIKSRSLKNGVAQEIEAGSTASIYLDGHRIDWLLAPYVHAPTRQQMQDFIDALRTALGSRLTRHAVVRLARSQTGRALLKRCYRSFGYVHNKVSMALYSGPRQPSGNRLSQVPFDCSDIESFCDQREIGWLATGDAELGTKTRLQALLHHYDGVRARVGVLALPHHGACSNFSPQLLVDLPRLHTCIAAAGRNRHGHPSSSVAAAVTARLGAQGWRHVSESNWSRFGIYAAL